MEKSKLFQKFLQEEEEKAESPRSLKEKFSDEEGIQKSEKKIKPEEEDPFFDDEYKGNPFKPKNISLTRGENYVEELKS